MTINELVKQAHATAKGKGWWNPAKSPVEVHMLIVSEIAEATECARKESLPAYNQLFEGDKPEGEAVELVDAIIRIADYFGYMGWNMEEILNLKMEYNKTRTYRHGNKKY